MGDHHFIDGLVHAEIEQSDDAKSAEATVSLSSSFDKFERFAAGAKAELTSKSLNSSLKAQVSYRYNIYSDCYSSFLFLKVGERSRAGRPLEL